MHIPNINPAFRDVRVLSNGYQLSQPQSTDNFQLITSPFNVLKLTNFISDQDYIHELIDSVKSLNFERKNNDLYSLSQTIDLNNVKVPSVLSFVSFLRNTVQPILSKVLNIKFNGKISVTASLYEKGDVLLCHDDKCEDRSVAFVYYLTGKKPKYGGTFDMFDHDENGQPTTISVSIPATYNSFICFEVGNYTYHQVAEIKSDKFQRLSINGWFHSDKALSIKTLNYKDPLPTLQQQTKLEGLVLLDEFVNLSYCTPTNLIEVRKKFEDESQVMLPDFFIPKFYSQCAQAFKSKEVVWNSMGPANRRKYKIADENTLPSPLETLNNLLKSSLFLSYFRNITGLSLVTELKRGTSEFVVEIQQWSPGSYSMATDNDEFFEKNGLDIYIFFNSDDILIEDGNTSGFITYLASDGNSEDSELLTIEPNDNSLYMVYRTNDTVRFTKYVNNCIKGSYYCVCLTYFEPDAVN